MSRNVAKSTCLTPGDTCQSLPQGKCGKDNSDGLCAWVGGGNQGRCSVVSGDSPTEAPTNWPTFAPTESAAPTIAPSYSVCYTNGEGTASAGERCGFPFKYKGVTYTECVQTPQTANGVKNWCLVERGTAWGGCDCTGTVTAKPTPSFTESPTLELPKCLTNGRGPADKGTNCKFPFNHNGALHYKCVGTGYGGEGFCKNERGIIGGCICDTR